MRIAFILLCHKNAQQVDKLIRSLRTKTTDFYIHLDKKTTEFPLSESENVYILPDDMRVDVRWARKSMVDATLSAIDYMLSQEKAYDYVCLLSGQDYPVKSRAEIHRYLELHHGKNFIEVLDHADLMYKRYSKRSVLFYPIWMQNRSFSARASKKLYIYATGGYRHTFGFARRKNLTELEFEFGSQWWCLTFDCLCWIRSYLTEHPEYADYFEHALVPDECFFQTLFMVSPYRNTRQNRLTYLEWDKNQNNPRLLSAADADTLVKSDYLFARKFDLSADSRVFDLIDQQIQEEE